MRGGGGKADERCSYVTIKNALILNSPWIGPVASCGPVRFKRSVSRRAISHVARALLLLLVFTTPPFQGNGLLSSRENHRGEFSIQFSFFFLFLARHIRDKNKEIKIVRFFSRVKRGISKIFNSKIGEIEESMFHPFP